MTPVPPFAATLSPNIVFAWGCDDLRLDGVVRQPQQDETPPTRANWIHATTGAAGATPVVIDDGDSAIVTFSMV